MILTGGVVGVVGGSFADPALRRDDCPPVLQDFWPVWVVRGGVRWAWWKEKGEVGREEEKTWLELGPAPLASLGTMLR